MKLESIIKTAVLLGLCLCIPMPAQTPDAQEGQARGESHFPEHAELYAPEPLQFPKVQDESIKLMTSPAQDRIVTIDAETGQEVILDINHEDLPDETQIEPCDKEGTEILDEQINLLDVAGCGIVANPQLYPASATCRLFYVKNGVQYSASGVLVDPLHVLTAGHCVHEGNGGDSVSSIVVVPGYADGAKPYGDARGVSFLVWSGWTLYGQVDDDIAVIELDRPIGALAGWHGLASNDSPYFYTENEFWMVGFPGEYMWYCHGNFDYTGFIDGRWQYDWLVIENLFQPGMGGCGAYNVDSDNNRYVHGVLSAATDRESIFARITPEKFYDILGFIDVHTPPIFDLQPLAVVASPERIPAGNRPSSLKYLVHNYSSASWSGTVNVKVYLSGNNTITTSDTLLDSHSFWHSFQPKSSVVVDVSPSPAIPVNTAPGQYWIGVKVDVSDYDQTNNISDVQAVASIQVEEAGPVLLFRDAFPSTTIDRDNWPTVTGATVDSVGISEPSGLYSLRLNGEDQIRSKTMNLSIYSSAMLSYYYERTGHGESPDPGDNLIIEYWNGSTWRELDRQYGSGPDMTSYDREIVPLPVNALRAGFKFRMRSTGDVLDIHPNDDWFVDNVELTAMY